MSRARNVADIMSGVGSNVVFDDGFGLDFGSSVLDDYEEGTWTPTANAITFANVRSARYIKVGSKVFVEAYVVFPTTSDGNDIYIQNLPFAVINATDAWYAGSFFTNSGNVDYLLARHNTSRIEVRIGTNGNNRPNSAYSTDVIILGLTYETN